MGAEIKFWKFNVSKKYSAYGNFRKYFNNGLACECG